MKTGTNEDQIMKKPQQRFFIKFHHSYFCYYTQTQYTMVGAYLKLMNAILNYMMNKRPQHY